MKTTYLAFASIALLLGTSFGDDNVLIIHNAQEFIQFGASVNNKETYRKTTVYLDADIDFAGALVAGDFEPIGTGLEAYNFQGTFDGQGHVLSNLAVGTKSSNATRQEYYGIFGYSDGASFRNLVIDSTCSVTCSSDSSSEISVGSLIGYIETYDYPIRIENIINMARVTYAATNAAASSAYLIIGGIVGEFNSILLNAHVRNCANYGSVVHSGVSGSTAMGGIVGSVIGSYSADAQVQNSLNYGIIAHTGSTKNALNIGGIAGRTAYLNTSIANCVSIGLIVANRNRDDKIGAIVGHLYKGTAADCYWDDNVHYAPCGAVEAGVYQGGSNYSTTSFVLEQTVTVGGYTGSSLLDALNAGAAARAADEFSRWALNRNRAAVVFMLNGERVLSKTNTQVIVLPSLATEGEVHFDGWYLDEACTQPLIDGEIKTNTVLYGKWNDKKN